MPQFSDPAQISQRKTLVFWRIGFLPFAPEPRSRGTCLLYQKTAKTGAVGFWLSDWRGYRQPLDAVINASASAEEEVEVAAAEEAGAGADGASRGGDGGGDDGQESQPSCVRQRPEVRP